MEIIIIIIISFLFNMSKMNFKWAHNRGTETTVLRLDHSERQGNICLPHWLSLFFRRYVYLLMNICIFFYFIYRKHSVYYFIIILRSYFSLLLLLLFKYAFLLLFPVRQSLLFSATQPQSKSISRIIIINVRIVVCVCMHAWSGRFHFSFCCCV